MRVRAEAGITNSYLPAGSAEGLMLPADQCQMWMLIIRATTMRGPDQRAALDEIHRRGAWLSFEQWKAAGFVTQAEYSKDYFDWFNNRRNK
jgi:hypothetical protein